MVEEDDVPTISIAEVIEAVCARLKLPSGRGLQVETSGLIESKPESARSFHLGEISVAAGLRGLL